MEEYSEEITLVELLLSLKDVFKYVLSKVIFILILGLLCSSIYAYIAFDEPALFKAKSVFTISELSNSEKGYGSFLGQLGIRGNNSEGGVSISKLDFLIKTENIIYSTFLKSTNQNRVLANDYIDLYLQEIWIDNESSYVDFKFQKNLSIDTLNRKQVSVLKYLKSHFVQNCLNTILDQDLGIMELIVTTESDTLSCNINEILLKTLSDFYTLDKIKLESDNYNFIKNRNDSLANEVTKLEYKIASYQDSHIAIVKSKAKLELQRLTRRLNLLYAMSTEAAKSYEITNMTLQEKKPFFQIIDYPRFPLPSARGDWKRNGIIGLIGGLFLGIILFIGIYYFKYFKQLIEEAEQENAQLE